MAKLAICLALYAMVLLGCSSPTLLSDEQEKLGRLIDSESEFSLELFKTAYESTNGSENIVLSSMAVYLSQIFAYLAASGETKKLIGSKLHLEWANGNDDEVYAAYFPNSNSRRVNVERGLEFDISNKFYIHEGISFENDLMAKFQENIFRYNCAADSEENREEVNQNIAFTARLPFQDFLEMNDVHPDTTCLAVDVAYFRGQFFGNFKTTEYPLFMGLDRKGPVRMMIQSCMLNVGVDVLWDAEIVELPFEGNDRIVMYVVLPTPGAETMTREEFNGFIARMSSTKLRYLSKNLKKTCVQVEIPEINLNKTYPHITNWGLDPLKIDAAPVNGSPKTLLFEEAHVARINIVPSGLAGDSCYTYNTIKLNRPFFYAVFDTESEQALVTGTYINPPE